MHKGFCSIGNNGTGLSFLLSETQILCPPLCAGIVLRVHVDGCERGDVSISVTMPERRVGAEGREREQERVSLDCLECIQVTRYYMKLSNLLLILCEGLHLILTQFHKKRE